MDKNWNRAARPLGRKNKKATGYTEHVSTTREVTVSAMTLDERTPADFTKLQTMYGCMRNTSVETGVIEDVLTFSVMAHSFAVLDLISTTEIRYEKKETSNSSSPDPGVTRSSRTSTALKSLDDMSDNEKIERWMGTVTEPPPQRATYSLTDQLIQDLGLDPIEADHTVPSNGSTTSAAAEEPHAQLSRELSLPPHLLDPVTGIETNMSGRSCSAVSGSTSPFTSPATDDPSQDFDMDIYVHDDPRHESPEYHEATTAGGDDQTSTLSPVISAGAPKPQGPHSAATPAQQTDIPMEGQQSSERPQRVSRPPLFHGFIDGSRTDVAEVGSIDRLFNSNNRDEDRDDGSGAMTPVFPNPFSTPLDVDLFGNELERLWVDQQNMARASGHSGSLYDGAGQEMNTSYPDWTGFGRGDGAAGRTTSYSTALPAGVQKTLSTTATALSAVAPLQLSSGRKRALPDPPRRTNRIDNDAINKFGPGGPADVFRPYPFESTTDDGIPKPKTTVTVEPVGFIYLMASPSFEDPLHMGELTFGVYIGDEYVDEPGLISSIEDVIAKAFKDPSCHRIQAIVPKHSEHTDWKQRKLYARSGFSFEGTRRRAYFSPIHQEYRDVTYWGIVDTDYFLDHNHCDPRNRMLPKDEVDELSKRHEREILEMQKGMDNRLKRSTSTETIRKRYEGIDFDDGLTVADSVGPSSVAPSVRRGPPSVVSAGASSAWSSSYHSLIGDGGAGGGAGAGSAEVGPSRREGSRSPSAAPSDVKPPSSPSLSSMSSWTDSDIEPMAQLEGRASSTSPPELVRSRNGSVGGRSSRSGWSILDDDGDFD